MPSFTCKHPTCTATLNAAGYCPQHRATGQRDRAASQRFYDQHARNPRSKAFYNSTEWKHPQNGARAVKLATTPWCERCKRVEAQHVHHIDPITTDKGWERRLDQTGLMSVCAACHNAIEAEAADDAPEASGMLALVECDRYGFDPEAADRPIRFIQRYCRHFEGQHAGKPFELHPVQARIVRDLYGWRDRKTGHRKHTQCWWEAAAGAGKSPTLAALGLFGLMADGEQGAQVYSVASNYGQARVVYDCAKRFIEQSAELSARLKVTQYEISHPASRSVWRIISGKGPKAGLRPSLVLADEIHEWPTREVYDSLQGRMTKRASPLWVSATNAGESRQSLCWQLHEEAAAVLADPSRNPKLYPVIWAAPKDADPASPASWELANPLIGITVKPEKIGDEWKRAQGSPALEARFRRLYLSQWVQGANKWLDLTTWDAATAEVTVPAEAPVYVGLDLSQGDDLCAAVFVYVTPDRFLVTSRFWLPRATAARYRESDDVPFPTWGDAGHITLLDSPTISPTVLQAIAAEIVAATKGRTATVCYDRYRADAAVAAMEASGLTCIPVAQGYTLSPGCMELERRLKEGSITIAPNPVLRWNAENVEVTGDTRGNIWPVKPHAHGTYAGTRSAKIDGIQALVTALTHARAHDFPESSKAWTGDILVI